MVNYSSKFGPTGGESDDAPVRESFVALAGGSYVASHDNLLGTADLGLYVLITGSSRHSATRRQSSCGDARQNLDQRLTRGEIDLDQYHRLNEALGYNRPISWPYKVR